MPYTTPTTRTTGDLITAAQYNVDLVDNVKFLRDPPKCQLGKAAVQSAANNTFVVVTWTTEAVDTNGMHDNVTNNTRITAVTSGIYYVWTSIMFAVNATGYRRIDFRRNGVLVVPAIAQNSIGTLGWMYSVGALLTAATNDYFEIAVVQTSGAALDISTTSVAQAVWMSGQ